MSEVDQGASGSKDQGSAKDQEIKDIEAKARKADQLLAETKQAKERAKSETEARERLEAELKELREAKLKEEGKFKEIAEAREKEARESKEELNRYKLEQERKLLRMKIKSAAMELGAKAEALDDLVAVAKIDVDLSADDSVVEAKIKEGLSEIKQKKSWFFGNTKAAPNDLNLSPGLPKDFEGKKLHELSHEQILELAKRVQ